MPHTAATIKDITKMMVSELPGSILDPPDIPASARTVLITLSCFMLAIVLFLVVEFILNLIRGTFWKRSNYNFLIFYLSMIFLLLFRICYCLSAKKIINFAGYVYALWVYFPAMFVVSCSMLFIDTILFSYLDAKGAEYKRQYGWVRLLPLVFMLVNWVCGVGFFTGIMYQIREEDHHRKTYIKWMNVYYYYSAIVVLVTCFGLIALTTVVMRELRRFLHYYEVKKRIFYLVIAVMIVELLLRVGHLIAAGMFLNDWEDECVENDRPDAFIYYAVYFVGCDVIPSIVFAVFLRQEIYQRREVEKEKNEGSIQITSVVSMLEAMYSRRTSNGGNSLLSHPVDSFGPDAYSNSKARSIN